jgi:excisionase family DNA binding protein
MYLASLRDPNSGAYRHPSVSQGPEKGGLSRLFQAMHKEAFDAWLNYGLEEQRADLELYFSSLDCSKQTAVQTWLDLESYRSLVPGSASSADRLLFVGDLEVVLKIMAREIPQLSTATEPCSPDGPLLSTKAVSEWLGVSSRTLRLWAESDEIPAVKVGRQWRFRRQDVREWLKRRGDGAHD